MNESRIIDIETKVAYQEATVQDLNDVIYRQQQQIDQLEKTCKALLERISSLSESAALGSAEDEKPPHY